MVNTPHVGKLLALLLLISLSSACSTSYDRLMFEMPAARPDNPAQIAWPPPPEVPRYLYIGDLRGESNRITDPKEKKGAMARFFSALVGLESEAIPLIDMLRPQHGSADDQGRVYIADPGRQSVFVFDETTSEFLIWNEKELRIPFRSPISVAIAEQSILVSDSEQGFVFEFNQQGEVLNRLGGDVLTRPTGVCYDAERQRIMVSDTEAGDIKIFDRQGKLLETLGSMGSEPGQFNRPTFLQYSNNQLYVSDSLNARVQVIDMTSRDSKIIGSRGLYVGNFSRPKGIAVDSDGNIYVTESYYDHLLIFNPAGELLLAIGGSGRQAGEFSQPTGVWIDRKDRLFVSDMLNSRVSIFQYLGGG